MLDLDRRIGLVDDVDIELSAAEFAMVHLLFTRRGIPMSKEAISEGLPVRIDPRMVDVYISRARAKLASAGLEGAIATAWGRGYVAGPVDDTQQPLVPPTPAEIDASLVSA